MKNDTPQCVQCGKPLHGGLLSEEDRERVAAAARFAMGEDENV